ncbi:MAG: GspH/FimT family pseudopilin [Comamonas sp.]
MRFRTLISGFTLIEMLVTLAVLAILGTLAAPSFVSQRRNAELTSVTNEFVAAIYAVRSEAMKRNMNGLLIPKIANTGWTSGWIGFVDADFSGTYNEGDTLVIERGAVDSSIQISATGTASGNTAYLLYNGSGFVKQKDNSLGGSTVELQRTDNAMAQYTRRIMIAKTGRVRTCTPTHLSTDTNCSSTNSD